MKSKGRLKFSGRSSRTIRYFSSSCCCISSAECVFSFRIMSGGKSCDNSIENGLPDGLFFVFHEIFCTFRGSFQQKRKMTVKKKIIAWTTVALLLLAAAFFYFKFYYVFGEGVKAGELNFVVYKGYVWKPTRAGPFRQASRKAAGAPPQQSSPTNSTSPLKTRRLPTP